MKDIVIIDYKLGNLFSVKHGFIEVGYNPIVTSEKEIVKNAEAIVLPGVGAFGDAMDNLHKLDLISPIKDHVNSGKPFIGICLGMQLLFTYSEEFGNHEGLDIVKGKIIKFPNILNEQKIKVPQIGWNKIYTKNKEKWEKSPLSTIQENSFMYFVHSFYAVPENDNEILTYTNYNDIEYCSSICKNNIFATQFHPEKSGKKGIEIYRNWLTNK